MLRCTSGWVQSWNRIFGLIVVQAVHIFNIFTCSERITIAIQILLFKTKLRLIYYSLHSLSLHKWNEQAALWKCLRSCKPKREHITSRKCLWNVWPCLELFYMTPSCQNLTYILSSLCFTMDFWMFLVLPSPILEKHLTLSQAHHWIICEENWPIVRNDQGSVVASTHSLAQWEKPRSTSRWILSWFSLPLRITCLLWSCAHPQLIL